MSMSTFCQRGQTAKYCRAQGHSVTMSLQPGACAAAGLFSSSAVAKYDAAAMPAVQAEPSPSFFGLIMYSVPR